MQYVYENASGERREITQGMNEDHPEAIVFDDAGVWHPCSPLDSGAFARVYGNVVVNGDPVSGRYPYVSDSLPTCLDRKLAPQRASRDRVVVESRQHDLKLQAVTGWEKA